jgi:uncharacterized protein YecE (DUF72 family)
MKERLHIGTSGYAYASWRGSFYPKGLKQSEWLGYYARHFDCVEINNTFYRQPESKNVTRWVAQVPAPFRFCFKIFRGLSHFKKLVDGEAEWQAFLQAIEPAHVYKGPLLLQLPPSLKLDTKRLDDFLRRTKSDWPMAVEFRHASWYTPETNRILNKNKVALVLHDKPGSKVSSPNDAPFMYVRFHGPEGDYGGSYSKVTLERWAEATRGWLAQGKTVYAFFNNDRDGYAVKNAVMLRESVEG